MRKGNLIEEEILKPDLASEIVLTVSGIVLFLPLLVFLVLAFAHSG